MMVPVPNTMPLHAHSRSSLQSKPIHKWERRAHAFESSLSQTTTSVFLSCHFNRPRLQATVDNLSQFSEKDLKIDAPKTANTFIDAIQSINARFSLTFS